MEENQTGGVDLSSYSNPKKKTVSVANGSDKQKNKNKIYLTVIAGCFLAMAALWAYYFSQNQEVPPASAPANMPAE